jgi:hypothetical protein
VCTATAAYATNYKKAQSVVFTKVLFGNVFILVIKLDSIIMFPASQTTMKSLWILGEVYTVKTRGDETQGKYSVWEIEVASNNGPHFTNIQWKMRHGIFWKVIFRLYMAAKKQRLVRDSSCMVQEESFIPARI